MQNCIKCGKALPDGAEFCCWCGKKQTTVKRKSRKRANKQGSVYKLSNPNLSRPWCAALPARYDEQKNKTQQILGYYKTKTEALNALNAAVSSDISVEKINYTLSHVYNEWSEQHYRNLSNSAIANYKSAWNYMKPYYKSKMRDLRATDIQTCIDKAVEDGRARATCEKIRNLYSQLCKHSMSIDIITQNYSQFLVLPPQDKEDKIPFTIDEMKKIEAEGSDTAKIILIMIFTGLRIGELFDMKKENVYLDDTPPRLIGGKKTEAGTNRIIPIHSHIIEIIRHFMDKKGDYLISNTKGNRKNEKNFREREYYPLLKSLGIEKKTPHCTRHTFATELQAAGAKEEDLIKVIGHADYSTTTENYVHQDISKLADMIELFDF